MMKGKTKNLTRRVRDALLALPDTVLMEALSEWLDGVDEQLLDWSDECRSALGYRIQSDETNKIYASFDELGHAPPGWSHTPRRCALTSLISHLNSFITP